MTSKRQDALTELRRRCRLIVKASGYQTDVGNSVHLGQRPTFGSADPEAALAIMPQEDEPGYQGENVAVVLPVHLEAIVQADADDPWSTVEAIIADIKQAVETDHDLRPPTGAAVLVTRGLERGTVLPLDREDGSEYVGAAVVYRLLMREQWGAP